MDLEILRRRTIRVLTAPPELLFALSRHWFAIGLCAALGTVFVIGKVATEPPVYHGRATLLLNEQAAVFPLERKSQGRPNTLALLSAHQALLESNAVLRTLVRDRGARLIFAQDRDPAARNTTGWLRIAREVRERITRALEWLSGRPGAEVLVDASEETVIQEAINAFRQRSAVEVNARSGSLVLAVRGLDRRQIESELYSWIQAYTIRREEMAGESQSFLEERVKEYLAREEAAREVLEEFRRENPDVSQINLDYLGIQITEQRLLRDQLRDRLEAGDVTPPEPLSSSPRVQQLVAEKRRLEAGRRQLLAEGWTEESDPVRKVDRNLEQLETELAGIQPEGLSPEERRLQLEERLGRIEERLEALHKSRGELSTRLARLKELEEAYGGVRQKREAFEQLEMEMGDRVKALVQMQVQTGDLPAAGTLPVNRNGPQQVALGSAGGLGLGILWALLAELLSTRIRCRSDVASELKIPVVGVIPGR